MKFAKKIRPDPGLKYSEALAPTLGRLFPDEAPLQPIDSESIARAQGLAHTLIMASKNHVLHLYRRSLKLALDWAVHRYVWRGQAMYIRELFEKNKHVSEPRRQKVLLEQTEELLQKWKHPDPYRPPTAPGGSKYERNLPCPQLDPPPPMHL